MPFGCLITQTTDYNYENEDDYIAYVLTTERGQGIGVAGALQSDTSE